MDSPFDARSQVMAIRSDCTPLFGLVVNPSSGSGPDGQSRTGSSSETRPVMASPASRVTRRRSDRSRHQLLSLALRHDASDSTPLARSGTRCVGAPCRQQRPEDPGLLGGQRDPRCMESAPGLQGQDPTAGRIRPSCELPPDGARAVEQQGAEGDIPTLGNPAQPSGAATGMLSGHHPHPGGKLAPVLKGVRIADRRHQGRRGDRPHTRDLPQPLDRFQVPRPLGDTTILAGNPLVQRPQAVGPVREDVTGQRRQLRRLQQLGQRSPPHADTGGHDQPVFGQPAPRLGDQGGPFRHQELPGRGGPSTPPAAPRP